MNTATTFLEPLSIDTAPEGSKENLRNIQKGFGFIPNLMAIFANSPSVLNGYLAMDGAWQRLATLWFEAD